MGHDEKAVGTFRADNLNATTGTITNVSSDTVVLSNQAGKAYSAGDVGMIILSGPKLYLNDGTSWKLVTSA